MKLGVLYMIGIKKAIGAIMGQHLNDKMVSFYMKTPAGFDMEYGYDGLQTEWDQHSAFEFAVSLPGMIFECWPDGRG